MVEEEELIMLAEFLFSKIHRATITDADLNYVGSITIDEDLMIAAKIREWQKVEILNINNGERFQTYVIKGKKGSKEICINGAAARKVQKGDKIIIVAYAYLESEKADDFSPTIVLVDDENNII
jgi:aspartate 1-decarboxylase